MAMFCKIKNCKNNIYAKNKCQKHYNRFIKSKDKRICIIKGCKGKLNCKSLCQKHYWRKKKYGDPFIKLNSPYKDPKRASINAIYGKYKDRAKVKNIKFDLNIKEFIDLISKPCYYCTNKLMSTMKTTSGRQRLYYNGLDRVNNKKGYVKSNIVPCCKICNRAKGDLTLKDFFSWIKKLKEHCNGPAN
jgi:hypothetical protein